MPPLQDMPHATGKRNRRAAGPKAHAECDPSLMHHPYEDYKEATVTQVSKTLIIIIVGFYTTFIFMMYYAIMQILSTGT